MAARSAWKGAVEFAGFPVNIRLYPRVKSRSGESFKTIAPDGNPVRSVYVDGSDNIVDRAVCKKGVEVGSGKGAEVHVLPDEALASIAEVEKSTSVSPRVFVPRTTLPLELAERAYSVIPDPDVAGADKSVSIVWNGLLANDLAYCTELTLRAGARDNILALYATEDGLWAVTLPFAQELHDPPTFAFERDDKAAQVFAQFVESEYQVRDFAVDEFESSWRERRQKAIEAALSGKPIKADAPSKPPAAGLMEILEGAAGQAPEKRGKGAKGKKAGAKSKKAKVAA